MRYRRFASALRRTSAELDLPEPLKSRIILEMAADLEMAAEHFRLQGLTEEEASARAAERFLASSEALASLVMVHTSGAERLASRLAWYLRSGFDLLLFWVGLMPLVLASGFVVMEQLRAPRGGIHLWIVLAMGCAVVILTLRSAYWLVSRRHPVSRVRRALFHTLSLGVLTGLIGMIGFVHGLYSIAISLGMGAPDVEPASWFTASAATLVESGTAFALALLVGIGAGFMYVVLVNRIAAIEQAESAALLAG